MLRLCNLRQLPATISCHRAVTTTVHPPEPHVYHRPEGELSYSRNWSRDRKLAYIYKPPQSGDRPFSFLTRRLNHNYELYPLLFIGAFWTVCAAAIVYISFQKIEIRTDHSSHAVPGYSWERVRDNYWKQHTLAYDPEGKSHRRLPLMETLEEEMLEAAKKRRGGEPPIETLEHEAYAPCHN